MNNIVFLVSGNGGTLKFIYEAIKVFRLNIKIKAVISDRDCGATNFSIKNNIPTHKIAVEKNNQRKLKHLIELIAPDLVITNIHKILTADVININNIKFVNLHYSLLPSFSGIIGMRTIEEAQKKNSMFIGATIHYVNDKVDDGHILGQCSTPVNWLNNTAEDYNNIIFQGGCLILLNYIMSFHLSQKSENEASYNNLLLNPPLRFSTSQFNSYFWNKLKK